MLPKRTISPSAVLGLQKQRSEHKKKITFVNKERLKSNKIKDTRQSTTRKNERGAVRENELKNN